MSNQANGGKYVPGNLTVAGDSSLHGDTTIGGALALTGALTLTGAAALSGGASVTGALDATGAVTGLESQRVAAVDGAVTIAPGTVVFTKAGVAAMTLAAPSAGQAGTRITFTSGTANAHTLTATGLIQDGITGGAKNLATFAAFVGASLTLEAYAGKWNVIAMNAVVIS